MNESGRPLSAIKFYFDKKDDAIVRADVIGSINISDYMGRPEIFVDYMESTDLDEYLPMPAFAYKQALANLVALIEENVVAEDVISLNDLVNDIRSKVEKSPFGLALLVEDIFQYRLLATNREIKTMIANGQLLIKMANEYHVPLNALIFSDNKSLVIKPYQDILSLSLINASVEGKTPQTCDYKRIN